MSIHHKALADIAWADIETVARGGEPENALLEFKGLLPEKNGRPHPWYDGRDQITDHTRDELAAEIVALANAYGGRLIIGIRETRDRPRKADGVEPLPRCEKFAEQFQQAFGSIVDPPIGGFQIRAIVDPAADGAGAVVIAVPASDLAPHGIGRPPAAYVRRGASCEPMTMRDLQSVFWDARTRRERVDAIRSSHSAEMANMSLIRQDHGLIDRNGSSVSPRTEGLFVRVSAISQSPLSIHPFPFEHWRLSLRPQIRDLSENAPAFDDGYFGSAWTRAAHGAWCVDDGPGKWSVRDDGTISIVGFRPGHTGSRPDVQTNFHAPSWYTALIAQVMIMTDRLRRDAGRPDVPIEIDVEFLSNGNVIGGGEGAYRYGGDRMGRQSRSVTIGPALLTDRASMANVFERLEEEVWHSFGLTAFERNEVDFQKAFARYAPAQP